MEIEKKHKELLLKLGLKEGDFDLFDGSHVDYQYDEEKGVRLYDPYYRTSYEEYMGIDGWSSWSSEEDTFMRDMLKKVHTEVERTQRERTETDSREITDALRKKFVKKSDAEAQ